MTRRYDPLERDRWARLRFAIIGPLLAAPPEPGQLRVRLRELSVRAWQHPRTGLAVHFGCSTIERWFSVEPGFMWSRRRQRRHQAACRASSLHIILVLLLALSAFDTSLRGGTRREACSLPDCGRRPE